MSFDVVMLTSAHAAMDDRIFYREAKTLVASGYAVGIVGRHPRSEVRDNIHIRALQDSRNRLKRLALGATILKLALNLNGRLYILHDPELIGVGLILRLLKKNVVYDAHEYLPGQILAKEWLPKYLRWLIIPFATGVEWLAGRLLSGVIAAVPRIQSRFPASRTELVRNFPTRSALSVVAEGPPVESRPNVVIYTGGLSKLRGILELTQALRALPHVELWLVGEFDHQEFREEIMSSLPPNVKWLGWKTHPEVLRLYRQAKFGALLLHPTVNHRCALPVKLFEYLGAGLPVIASNFPEYRTLVEECGFQVDPLRVDAIIRTISAALSDPAKLAEMSRRARERALKSFCWEEEGSRLVRFCVAHMSECHARTPEETPA